LKGRTSAFLLFPADDLRRKEAIEMMMEEEKRRGKGQGAQ